MHILFYILLVCVSISYFIIQYKAANVSVNRNTLSFYLMFTNIDSM